MDPLIDALLDEKRDLKERIATYFNGDPTPNPQERGYQELLASLEDLQDELNSLNADD